MRRFTIFLLVLVTVVARSDEGVDITAPQQIAALTDIQEQIDLISAEVADCISSGKDHGDCFCENEKLVLNFNRAVAEFFATYPDLETVDIVRFAMADGLAVSQSLSGIENQARSERGCT
jgi:hypothetical protein